MDTGVAPEITPAPSPATCRIVYTLVTVDSEYLVVGLTR